MMFLIGFIAGFVASSILFIVAYAVVRELIFRFGKPVARMIEKELVDLGEETKDGTQIVFPNLVKEMFMKEDSTLDDNIT